MNYSNNYAALKKLFTSSETKKEYDTIELHDLEFQSASCAILPGMQDYKCDIHNLTLKEEFSFYTEIGSIDRNIHVKDISVEENRSFKYQIIKPKGINKIQKAVFLFHGFNEKDWTKYLPWAKAICDGTGSAVILFQLHFTCSVPKKLEQQKRNVQTERTEKREIPQYCQFYAIKRCHKYEIACHASTFHMVGTANLLRCDTTNWQH